MGSSYDPPNPRYKGKPLLRLLELYVLWSINKLSEEQVTFLNQITPKLQATYRRQGSWYEVLMAELYFFPELPSKLRELWEHNSQIALQHKMELTPQQFAEMFVDENWSKLL